MANTDVHTTIENTMQPALVTDPKTSETMLYRTFSTLHTYPPPFPALTEGQDYPPSRSQ